MAGRPLRGMAEERGSRALRPGSIPVSVSGLAAEWAAGGGSRDSKETSDRARLGWLPRLPHSKGG